MQEKSQFFSADMNKYQKVLYFFFQIITCLISYLVSNKFYRTTVCNLKIDYTIIFKIENTYYTHTVADSKINAERNSS